jgi:hypothetical protein
VAFFMVILSMLFGSGLVRSAGAQGSEIEKTTEYQASAFVSWCEPSPDGETCYDLELLAVARNFFLEANVCVNLTGVGPKGETFEEGCADVAPAFQLDRFELSSASLFEVEVQLVGEVCDPETGSCDIGPTRKVTIAVDWVGFGDIEKHIQRITEPPSGCVVDFKLKGQVRNATATLVFNGASHAGTGVIVVTEIDKRVRC